MKVDIRIRLGNDEFNFGKGVVMLLEGIEKYGSLSSTYKQMNMSSSKAWKILNNAQKDLGYSLVKGYTGGKDGGKTALTKEGKELLEKYKVMSNEIHQISEEIFHKYF